MLITIIALGFFFSIIFVKDRENKTFRKTLREGAPMVLLSSFIGTFGGVGLASIREEIEKKPSILILYPALIDTLGDIGSILGARLTTKLALGRISSFWDTLKEGLSDLVSVEIAAIFIHIMFGLTAFLLGRVTGFFPNLWSLINISIMSNLISFIFISLLAFVVATQTFKYSLDPDNFVIPLVTSIADFVDTLALILTLMILRV